TFRILRSARNPAEARNAPQILSARRTRPRMTRPSSAPPLCKTRRGRIRRSARASISLGCACRLWPSPFSKPHYVSHTIGDHTSMLAFIEKRFLSMEEEEEPRRDDGEDRDDEDRDGDRRKISRLHLTLRDKF